MLPHRFATLKPQSFGGGFFFCGVPFLLDPSNYLTLIYTYSDLCNAICLNSACFSFPPPNLRKITCYR